MKKIVLAFFLFLFLYPILLPGQTGAYNTISGILICKDEISCYHEIAHKIDKKQKWISSSYEFELAIHTFLFVELRDQPPNPLSVVLIERVFRNPNKYFQFVDVNAESYAFIFEYSQGKRENMPDIFRDFYDWDLAEKLIARYIGE